MDTSPIIESAGPRRPTWQTAALWFACGLALTWLAAFFFDRRRGAARRQMAVDRTMAQARDMAEWSGQKMRHLGNKAQGKMAELSDRDDDPSRAAV